MDKKSLLLKKREDLQSLLTSLEKLRDGATQRIGKIKGTIGADSVVCRINNRPPPYSDLSRYEPEISEALEESKKHTDMINKTQKELREVESELLRLGWNYENP